MGERLRAIFDGNDWRADPSKPVDRIPYYQMLLTRKLSLPDEMAVRMELGNEQMRPGRSERAVETLETLLKRIAPGLGKVPIAIQAQIHEELALAYLRLVSSFGGNPMRQHIGVGQAASTREIEIWWPVSGLRQRFRNVAVDRTFHVKEGRDVLDPVEVKPFEIGKTKIARTMHDHRH